MLPSPDILSEFPQGKFVLSNLAAKRAKQLREGAPPLVQIESNHPLTIALAEIAAGKIKPIMPSIDSVGIGTAEAAMLIDETMPAELGLLLPALDETEAALVSSDAIVGEDDHEDHAEVDPDELTLSGLAGEDEEEEEVVVASDADTLSLSDIAEEESAGEDSDDEV
ncbi:MAG: DNA-directed RNA polymerase subunit omega [Chlorobia bacterium]|nr:DNA-directed RNA polymerase subunit omega [Fimbriimonadaceae bacterium]